MSAARQLVGDEIMDAFELALREAADAIAARDDEALKVHLATATELSGFVMAKVVAEAARLGGGST